VTLPVTKPADSPITKKEPRRSANYPGPDTTEVAVMQSKDNEIRVRVTYTAVCPEWWRIQVRRRLGRQGLATRAECVEWLRRYGESEDDNLALAFERWQLAAAGGEEVTAPSWDAEC
jgi:hypothetical protein